MLKVELERRIVDLESQVFAQEELIKELRASSTTRPRSNNTKATAFLLIVGKETHKYPSMLLAKEAYQRCVSAGYKAVIHRA